MMYNLSTVASSLQIKSLKKVRRRQFLLYHGIILQVRQYNKDKLQNSQVEKISTCTAVQ